MNSWDGTLYTVGIPYEVHNKHSQKNLGIPYSLIHCSQYEDYAMNAWEAWPDTLIHCSQYKDNTMDAWEAWPDAYIGRTANRYIFYILPEKGRKLSPQQNFGLFVVFTPPPHPHVACSFIQAVWAVPVVLFKLWRQRVPVVLFKLWRQSELKHRQEFARVRGAFIYDTVYTKYPSLEPRTQLRWMSKASCLQSTYSVFKAIASGCIV